MKPRLIVIGTLIIGAAVLSYSLTLPYYTDQEAAKVLLNNYNYQEKGDYYKLESELRTNKTTLMDLGAGIVLASGIILLYLAVTKTKSFKDFSNLKTLKRSTAFITVNVLWLLMIPGTIWYYTYRGGRGDYPPFADSIAIPIYYQLQFLLYLILPLNIFIFLTTLNTNLPTNLFVKPDRYGVPVILLELFFGVCLLLNLLCLIVFVADGDHISIFVILYFTYIVLSLRAGQISRYKQVPINL